MRKQRHENSLANEQYYKSNVMVCSAKETTFPYCNLLNFLHLPSEILNTTNQHVKKCHILFDEIKMQKGGKASLMTTLAVSLRQQLEYLVNELSRFCSGFCVFFKESFKIYNYNVYLL